MPLNALHMLFQMPLDIWKMSKGIYTCLHKISGICAYLLGAAGWRDDGTQGELAAVGESNKVHISRMEKQVAQAYAQLKV